MHRVQWIDKAKKQSGQNSIVKFLVFLWIPNEFDIKMQTLDSYLTEQDMKINLSFDLEYSSFGLFEFGFCEERFFLPFHISLFAGSLKTIRIVVPLPLTH